MEITCILNQGDIEIAINNYLRTYSNLKLVEIVKIENTPISLTVKAQKIESTSSSSFYDR